MPTWLIQIAIAIATQLLIFALTPKPKTPKPSQLAPPTASAGKPIPKVFGTKTVTEVNTLWYGDKSINKRKKN